MNEQATPPPPEAELFPPLLKVAAVVAGGQLGLFKALAGGPLPVPEIARATGASEVGITRLVEALAALGSLERSGDRYANGPSARAWLTPDSPADYSASPLLIGDLWSLFGELGQTVRRGAPERTLYRYMEDHPEVGLHFSRSLRGNGQLLAGPVAKTVSLPPKARRLLDVGGSHGLYSIAFCRQNPGLEAVILDLPAALQETAGIIAAEGLAGRVKVQRADYLSGDLGQGYDVVLLFGIIDGNSLEQNGRLFRDVARALNPGGLVAVMSHIRTEPPDAPSGVFGLMMFLAYGTRTYSYPEITYWLAEAGFGNPNRFDLPPTGAISVVTAVKVDG